MKDNEQVLRLQAIFEAAIDGIIVIDAHGRIESVNPAGAQIFGYEVGEMLGQSVNMLMPEPHHSAHDSYMGHYLRTGEKKIIGIGREVPGRRKDGSLFPFRLAISEVRVEGGVHLFTGIVHDLSREKQAEEQLRQYAARLERSNQELENFAFVSSHDLQEPLRKIQAFGSRLEEREGEKLSEQGRDYLGRMLNAAGRMQNLINDLLTFSRVSTKGQEFVPVRLGDIVREVMSDLEIPIREAKAHIQVDALPTIQADPTQMRQLFQNLISNAVKFRRPEFACEVHIYEAPQAPGSPMAEIHVQDNGIGFDEKYLDRIFEIFQRLEGRNFAGSGIGLAICRRICVRHGGEITARSRPGEGALFIVRLARKPAADLSD